MDNTLKIIIIVLIILLIGGLAWLFVGFMEEEDLPEEDLEKEEIYSFSGVVSSTENGSFVVVLEEEERELVIDPSDDTRIFRSDVPEERDSVFTMETIDVDVDDIKEGDRVFIKSKVNVFGLEELEDIDYIEVI